MQALEITQEMLEPQLTGLTLDYLAGEMVWPHDTEMRDRAMKTAVALNLNTMARVPAARRAIETEIDLFQLAINATSPQDLRQMAQHPWAHGVLAGELLRAAILGHVIDGAFKLESIKSAMTANKRRKAHKWLNLKRSTLDNIWKTYKPVAHLWAAYVNAALDGDRAFPCRPEAVKEFLSRARWFEERGLIIHSLRNPPLLSLKTIRAIPQALELERTSLTLADGQRF